MKCDFSMYIFSVIPPPPPPPNTYPPPKRSQRVYIYIHIQMWGSQMWLIDMKIVILLKFKLQSPFFWHYDITVIQTLQAVTHSDIYIYKIHTNNITSKTAFNQDKASILTLQFILYISKWTPTSSFTQIYTKCSQKSPPLCPPKFITNSIFNQHNYWNHQEIHIFKSCIKKE